MPKRLSIQIESREAKPDAKTVIAGIEQCLGALYGPATDLSQVKVIKMTMNSPLTLTLEGPTVASEPFLQAVSYLEKRVKPAKRIAADVLRRVESLRSVFADGIASIQICSGRKRAQLNEGVVESATAMLRQSPVAQLREETGQIEGMMEAIFAPGDKRTFRLRDRLTGRPIECIVPPQEFAAAKDALPGRVLVNGRIRYNDQGQATSVSVTSLRVIPGRKMSWRDWQPINITDGADAADYVRELRNV